jgi:hypothetical protein
MGRGPDPEDHRSFGPDAVPRLRAAVEELSWLLSRGYADGAAATLVGDRHQLTDRQRKVVARAACADDDLARRAALRRPLAGPLAIDGFNQVIGLERALAGGPVFRGRDGALRDLAAVHGTWRPVETTDRALARLAEVIPGDGRWFLDRPVSNSGRLAAAIRALAEARGLRWTVEVTDAADAALLAAGLPLATGDGGLLGRAPWVDLLGAALPPDAWVVPLG